MSIEAVRGSTSVAILTAEGRSAVAVIAVIGPIAEKTIDQYFQAANGQSLPEQPLNRIIYGHWGKGIGEDLILCRRAIGKVEVHCHGGTASTAQILGHLTAAGCEPINWQQQLTDQSVDTLALEAHTALAEASTLRTASILLDQFHGALRNEVVAIKELQIRGKEKRAQEKIQRLLHHADLGLHLTQPWRVVIAGLPNVGKSSLINAIVGYQRAIVFDQPGTTRDIVSATTAIEGWPVKLSDTAGLHQTADVLENAGIVLAQDQLTTADLVIWVLDAQSVELAAGESPHELAHQQLKASGAESHKNPLLVVVNKIDLLPSPTSIKASAIAISAQNNIGLDALLQAIAHSLIPHPPSAGTPIPFTQRQVLLLQQGLDYVQQGQFDLAVSTLEKLLTQGE